MDVVPCRLDVAEVGHVVDVQRGDDVLADEARGPAVFEASLLCTASGSARVAPSPPPSRFAPAQELTCIPRAPNMGASAVRMSVSPVLPSCPANGMPRRAASSRRTGSESPAEGVNPA